MAKAIHCMIRVFDLDRSKDFYQRAFGMEVAGHFDFDDFSLTYLRNAENDFEIELTLNKDQQEPYSHGSGYGHVAFCVDDLDAEYSKMKQEHIDPTDIVAFSPGGELMARFFFVTDPDGYEIEVLQRHGRYQ